MKIRHSFSIWTASLLFVVAILTGQLPAEEASKPAFVKPVTASLVVDKEPILPGETFSIALHLKLGPKWHAYWKNPGDAGAPPEVVWKLPEGFTVKEVLWATPKRFELGSAVGFGYEDEMTLIAEVVAPITPVPSPLLLAADVEWVVCNEVTCLPGESHAELVLDGQEGSPAAEQVVFFEKARGQIPQKSHDLVVSRKGNHVEVVVPQGTLNGEVRKVEFFPDDSSTMRTSLVPHWIPGEKGEMQGTVVLPETGSDVEVTGVMVLHYETGPSAFEIGVPESNAREVAVGRVAKPGMTVATEQSTKPAVAASEGDFDHEGGFWAALALAFVGGMILNLMPCVLPIISFKVLGFVRLAGQSRKLVVKHGVAFCVGVLLSFWVLAALLLLMQTYGHAVGWGFQLQEPLFVVVLASIIFIFGLSLFGVFEMGTSLIGAASQGISQAQSGGKLTGSFFSGVLATAVATPCTGPFLGSAVGFAVTLSPLKAMLIFTAIGLGMGLPYLALSAFPALLKYMPKPGAWMETFKQLMGFMMVATTGWLVWVFGAQMGSFSMSLLLMAMFIFSLGAWIYGRWDTPVRSYQARLFGRAAALIVFAFGCFVAYTATTSWSEAMSGVYDSAEEKEIAAEWEEYSPERVAELRSKGIPVFVDFTAKWCLICQMNHVILSMDEVSQGFAARGVVKMKADWTKRDGMIAAELKKLGRNSVPVYALYAPGEETAPQILPQVLTQEIVLSAILQLESR